MSYPAIISYETALSAPKGQRPLKSGRLDSINDAEIKRSPGNPYLLWASGGFAAVYCCELAQGGFEAFRCLTTSPSPDIANRYAEYESFRQGNPLPYLVSAVYIEDGIFVGDWYPVFVMTWVRGETLQQRVTSLVQKGQQGELFALAAKWEEMMEALQGAGVAHGDLQPENIMVDTSGNLRLVDYDTIYVPGMTATMNAIAGCPGYVHPSYLGGTQRALNSDMDTFGALVILLSLRALAYDPSLFGRFSKANLFFRDMDMEEPDMSAAFDYLEAMGEPSISDLARYIREACRQPNEGMLSFGQFVQHHVPPYQVVSSGLQPRQESSPVQGLVSSGVQPRQVSSPTHGLVTSGVPPRQPNAPGSTGI